MKPTNDQAMTSCTLCPRKCGVGVDNVSQKQLGAHAKDLCRADGGGTLAGIVKSHISTVRPEAPFSWDGS